MNKKNIREIREQEKQKKRDEFRRISEEKKAEELALRELERQKQLALEEEKRRKKIAELFNSDSTQERRKRSTAKAKGLKSTFALADGKVLMTSFGKGNDAVIEKIIEGKAVTDCRNNLTVKPLEKDFRLEGGNPVVAGDPFRKSEVGKDIIDRKAVIEEKYFGQTFDDNIHIQLAYNIMDIEKILSVHINNILYGLNNVLNRNAENPTDFVGSITATKYEEFRDTNKYKILKKCTNTPQLAYFGTAFFNTGFDIKEEKEEISQKNEKDIYYILCLLSTVRQFLAHENDTSRIEEKGTNQVALYTFDEGFDDLYEMKSFRQEARKILDKFYSERVNSLNESFLEKAGKDLTIIFRTYNIKSREDKLNIVRKYYDFLVRKEYKYLGFSMKKLRCILSIENEKIDDEKYDKMRRRLNRLIDFVIYMYYEKNPEKAKRMVEKLRAHSDDDEKNRIYFDEGKKLHTEINDTIRYKILPEMNENNFADMEADNIITELSVEDLVKDKWAPIGINSTYFIKIIYLLTLFLDGKEINDLVTTLINKFENIASFNSLFGEKEEYKESLESIENEIEFKREYSIFSDSKNISSELCALNSFARMEKPNISSECTMFVEAAQMLGDKGTPEELEKYFKTLHDKKCTKAEKGVRNFIKNNVINSTRFKYLIRYCNVKEIRSFAENKYLVEFVLKKSIAEKQILRYYKSCIDDRATEYRDSMCTELAEIISGVTYEQFKDVKQKVKRNTVEEKKKQNVIRLYLTACYLFFKNLIYVNSRYFLAFYCLERDFSLWGFEKPGKTDYTTLTRKFLEENRVRHKPKKIRTVDSEGNVSYTEDKSENHIPAVYFKTNLDNSDIATINSFRNSAEHFNAIRNSADYLKDIKSGESYYQIYHYIVQRQLIDHVKNSRKINVSEKTLEYFANVEKYGTYSKDFVKALCIPFGYNLARFKNLSIDGLFDMHDTREDRKCSIDD